jgi:hypothetical protein
METPDSNEETDVEGRVAQRLQGRVTPLLTKEGVGQQAL